MCCTPKILVTEGALLLSNLATTAHFAYVDILQIKHLLHIFVFCISYIQPVTLPPMCCTPKIFVIDVAFIVFVFAYFVQNFANAHFAYVDNPADLASIAHFRILHIQHSTCHFAHHQCAAH